MGPNNFARHHLWGHKATKNLTTISKLKRISRLSLLGMAPMWKGSPTSGLEIIMNRRPVHLEITKVGMRNYIRIRDEIPKSWNGLSHSTKKVGHLLHWNRLARKIEFQDGCILDYKCEILKTTVFNWTPSVIDPGLHEMREELQGKHNVDFEVSPEDIFNDDWHFEASREDLNKNVGWKNYSFTHKNFSR